MNTSVSDLDLNTVDLTNLELFAEGPHRSSSLG